MSFSGKRAEPLVFDWAQFRIFLLWCLPALAVGLFLRVLLTFQMPYGYFQFDTPDFLVTPHRLFSTGDLVIHGKKTFLIPVLYSLSFFLFIPALIVIPAVQHLLGLGFILIFGGLTRLWFAKWKIFIIPVTILTAINPALLWFEHSLMSEFVYIFCIGALLLAGTIYYLWPTQRHFWILMTVVILVAGTRPEGKFLSAFAVLVIAFAHFREFPLLKKRLGITMAIVALLFAITRTGEGGSLLYASVIHLTPDKIKVAPELEPVLLPVRDELRSQWTVMPKDTKSVQKRINQLLDGYLKDHPGMSQNDLAKKLAREACLNRPLALPLIAINKFRDGVDTASVGLFDEKWLYEKQSRAWHRNLKNNLFLSKKLTGRVLHSNEEAMLWIKEKFQPLDWFNHLHKTWFDAIYDYRLPDTKTSQLTLLGVPYFFLLAYIGLLSTLLRPGKLWCVHLAATGMWLGLFTINFLVGPLNQRYRFIFEPFSVVYLFILGDALIVAGWYFFLKLRRTSQTAIAEQA